MLPVLDIKAQKNQLSKALIIDKSDTFRNKLIEFFTRSKVSVVELLDMNDIRSVLEQFVPDILFIDIEIIIKENELFLEKIREDFPGLYIVINIGSTFYPEIHDLLENRADGFLCKNVIDISLLTYIMGVFFERRQARQEADYYSELLEKNIEELRVKHHELSNESRDKLLFIRQLSSNIQLPLDQLIQFAHIGLQRIHRKQTALVGSYLAEVKLISEELMIYINDLKEISLLKTGDSEFSLEEIDLVEFLKVIHRQFQPIADSRSLNLIFQISIQTPCIMADHNKLSKVMNILLRNSFRYIPNKGEVLVKAWQEGQIVYLSVNDSGPSIPEDQREKLFNMYDQPKMSNTKGIRGFGLSICKELMLGQNGDIRLGSNEKKEGSTFILSLPVAQSLLD